MPSQCQWSSSSSPNSRTQWFHTSAMSPSPTSMLLSLNIGSYWCFSWKIRKFEQSKQERIYVLLLLSTLKKETTQCPCKPALDPTSYNTSS